jgi:hypothetical protein
VSTVERPILGSFKRVADRKLAMRFGAISATSLAVALLDAAGLLLVQALSEQHAAAEFEAVMQA